MSNKLNLNILILDDEKRVRDEIEEFLKGRGFTVFKASRPSEAFKLVEKNKTDLAILDIKLPEMDGLEVLKSLKKEHPGLEIIMISGHGDISSVIEAMRLGAADFFQKPFRLLEINSAIERTTRFITLQKKLNEVEKSYSLLSKELKKNTGHQLLGESTAIKNVVELMTKVARAGDISVLITGESGTGKETGCQGNSLPE